MKKDKLAFIIIGTKCSNKCVFCKKTYAPPALEKELKIQEIQTYKSLISYREKGYKNISITGNDPLEYEKIVPLIKYIRKIGFDRIIFCTHGRVPKDNDIMKQLIDSGVTFIRIPIYGSNAKIHESITQTKGSFEETMNGIKSIKKLSKNISLGLITVIVQQNKKDLLNITKLALKFNPYNLQIEVAHLYPGVKDQSFCVPYKDLGRFVKKLVDYRFRMNINIDFNDIPYCVFGADYDFVNMPLNLLSHEKPKGKLDMCNNCKVSYKCDGFFMNDIKKYGIGDLKPIV